LLESEENHLDHMPGDQKHVDERGKMKELAHTSDSVLL